MNNKTITLYQPFGGLADNLIYSHLPYLFHEIGIEFHLNKFNAYRNDGIKQLVWDYNPYVNKTRINHGNACGSNTTPALNGGFYIHAINRAHLQQYDSVYVPELKNPILYAPLSLLYNESAYIDNKIINNATVIHLQSISMKHTANFIGKACSYANGIAIAEQNASLKLNIVDNVNSAKYYGDEVQLHDRGVNIKALDVNNIFTHCGIILKAKQYICLNGGGCLLASAVKASYNSNVNIICLVDKDEKQALERGLYKMENVNYIYL